VSERTGILKGERSGSRKRKGGYLVKGLRRDLVPSRLWGGRENSIVPWGKTQRFGWVTTRGGKNSSG